jgi:integrase/recombinase XerD
MLSDSVGSYLSLRRGLGYRLKEVGLHLTSFAAYSDQRGYQHIRAQAVIEWAGQAPSLVQRARRLGDVARFARYLKAEDARHEIPPKIFGSEHYSRPTPYILSGEQIIRLLQLAGQSGYRTLRRQTYTTLFGLLACTGLRVSEAIRLRYDDITADGLLIRASKFRKSRLVPLHTTAQAALERYLQLRRPYAPLDDHVFISLRRKPLLIADADTAFRSVITQMGLPVGGRQRRPTPHCLRHTFAVRSLLTCPDGRDHITKHMLMLSTYLGHSNAALTYWYQEAVPELMRGIAERCERHFGGGAL